MKTLLLALLLLIPVPCIAQAQTPATVSDKNIRECFKRTPKAPSDFDRCVADEFRRVREDKEYRDARVKVGKDPYGGCGKRNAYKECYEEIMADMRVTTEGLYDGSGSSDYYYPPIPVYRFYYPSRYYRYRFPFTYPRRFSFGTTYRRWRY